MKYYAISDLHGFYSLATAALSFAGFDPDDKNATLLVLGDIWDRGSEPVYCMNLAKGFVPDKNGGLRPMANKPIMIKGNHEVCFDEMVARGYPAPYDYSNRTNETFDLIKMYYEKHGSDPNAAIDSIVAWHKTLPWYKEIGDCIFVHSWIPLSGMEKSNMIDQNYGSYSVRKYWQRASAEAWKRAIWANPTECYARGLVPEGKTLVIGHWHASAFHARFEPERGLTELYIPCDFSAYVDKGIVAIDACTAYTRQCNVAIFSDDGGMHLEKTVIYPATLVKGGKGNGA